MPSVPPSPSGQPHAAYYSMNSPSTSGSSCVDSDYGRVALLRSGGSSRLSSNKVLPLQPQQRVGPMALGEASINAVVPHSDGYGDVETGGQQQQQPHMATSASRGQLADHGLMTAHKLQIVYQDLCYSIRIKPAGGGSLDKAIIKGISGTIEPARLTAVMGASGAGKTTFLNVLAGYAQGKVTVSGRITVNGEEVNRERMRQISGFVHQEDCILGTMTVREALYMAAELKLPSDVSRSAKLRRALDVAGDLNITRVLDNTVGDSMSKGISGGEKRRLSLGMELITNPSALFLDEPTSGLDTHTAYKVISILQSVAQRQSRTMVATIHQPSSDIFHTFHDLIVLADGQVMYHGLASGLVAYFDRLGYRCPTYTNPADYLFMDVLNRGVLLENAASLETAGSGKAADMEIKYTAVPMAVATETAVAAQPPAGLMSKVKGLFGGGGAKPDADDNMGPEAIKAKEVEEERIRSLLDSWRDSPENAALQARVRDEKAQVQGGVAAGALLHYANFFTQFALLSGRAARNMWRNPLILKGKLAQTMILALIVGLIFRDLNDDLKGVQNREGSLFFLMVQGLFGAVMGIITVFGTEKPVFKREYESRMYGLPAFFWSRYAVELPSQIVFPILSSVVVYWLIGYQNTAAKFLWFMLASVLINLSGASMGMFVACLFDDIAVAMTVMPVFLMPLMIFSGFFVNSQDIPVYLAWIQYISPVRYAFFAVAENEFEGLAIHCTPEQNCTPGYSGQDVINLLGITQTVAENCLILLAMVVALLGLAYVMLWNTVRQLNK